MLRTKPIELECGTDEVLCLVDKGSTINAAWVEKQFPQHAKHVKDTPKSLRGDRATTAGCVKVYNKGRVEIDCTVNGKAFQINFKDMEAELPILRVRKMVNNQNDVHVVLEGGWIQHRDIGRAIKLYKHEGVCFMKLKVAGPHDEPSQLGFARPGTP